MNTLHFDFTQSATRASILAQLAAALGEDAAAQAAQQAQNAGVPDKMHHHPADVYQTIDSLSVTDRVKADMRAVYEILTQAEATVHENPIDHVHFHEVGRAKGIVNVAEICIAFDMLNPEKVTATPVQTGDGILNCAHGTLSCPAPATAVILDGGIPTCVERLEGETVTPTSAAVIKHFVQEFTGVGADRTYFQGPVPENPHGHHHDHDHGEGHHHHDHGEGHHHHHE